MVAQPTPVVLLFLPLLVCGGAAGPFYVDPLFSGAHDPELVFNREEVCDWAFALPCQVVLSVHHSVDLHSLTCLTDPFTHHSTHSLTHSLIHLRTYSPTHAPTHAPTHTATRAAIHVTGPPTHSLTHTPTHSPIKSYSLTFSCNRPYCPTVGTVVVSKLLPCAHCRNGIPHGDIRCIAVARHRGVGGCCTSRTVTTSLSVILTHLDSPASPTLAWHRPRMVARAVR
jgi:hypothetical protein